VATVTLDRPEQRNAISIAMLEQVTKALGDLSTDPDVRALAFPLTALILIGMGLGLGAVGSGLTLRRFLQV
jgi:1,4-dihydroxy-2-naphthoyl-CoA synthase